MMMKSLCTLIALLMFTSTSFSTPITPIGLIGRYKAQGRVLIKKFYVKIRIINTQAFEIQETDSYGNGKEICDGSYRLDSSKKFFGAVSCPSDRTKRATFNIDFANLQLEELTAGANVYITTSKTGNLRVKTFVKKY